MFIQVVSGIINLVFDSNTIVLKRVSSVLFRNAAIFKLYCREAAQDCFQTCSLLYNQAKEKLTYELYNAFLTMENFLAELCNDTKHLKNKTEKKQVNARFNASLKCHSSYPEYLEKRKDKKRKAA